MKVFVALSLLLLCAAASLIDAAHHEVHAEQNYCPRNERKSCRVQPQNREKFDFLLSCPASAPLYKLRGSYQGESQFSTTKNSAWHSSYLFTQNSEMLNNAKYQFNTGTTLSPNMFGVTRSDRDVYLFESSFENGIVDERQGACRSWHHQFAANKDVFLFDSGNGKPIIVAQDARWGSRRWGEGVQEINQAQDFFGHQFCWSWPFDCDDGQSYDEWPDQVNPGTPDVATTQPWRNQMFHGVWDNWHDGGFMDSSYKYTGQWLYSVCNDADCTSASTPRPFWGRDIGSPLHQNTLAELAYFPMAPDWAYNSPVLGATPSQLSQDHPGFYTNRLPNSWAVGNTPGGIASTHVTNHRGEKVLALMVSGLPMSNGGRDASFFDEDVSPLGAWYLLWCQQSSCDTWGVRKIQDTTWEFNSFSGSRTSGWANLRPSLATSASGDTVYVMLHERGDSAVVATQSLSIVPLEFTSDTPSTSEKIDRATHFSEIYAELIGIPTGTSSEYVGLDLDTDDWTTNGAKFPFSSKSTGGAWNTANHPLLAAPLKNGYGGSQQPFQYEQSFDPTMVCTGLEDYGVKADPWCHWTTYFVHNGDREEIAVTHSEVLDMGYDVVVPCEGTPYYFAARRGAAQHEASDDYAAVMWTDLSQTWYWPKQIADEDSNIAQHAGVNMSPYQMGDMVLGRRFSAVRSANGQPFFTWADLGAGLGDGAVQTWGVCGFTGSPASVEPTCHTLLDSIELGTMGWLNGFAGKTLLLSAPDDELPVMVYYFDHFGGSGSYVEYGVDGFHVAANSVRGPAQGLDNEDVRTEGTLAGYESASVQAEFSDVSSRLRVPQPGQVTNRPLVIACLDALCEEASVSAFAPARMADIVNWWQGPAYTGLDINSRFVPGNTHFNAQSSCVDYLGRLTDCTNLQDMGALPGSNKVLYDKLQPGNVDNLNVAEYALFSLRQVNAAIRADARFVGNQLYVVLNEGGYDDEFANNPVKVWRTNRWASPTGMPCSGGNAGERVVADDVVYICTRSRIGSDSAKLYAGTTARPWTRLYEWVKMDWGYGLRNLGGFLGWGSDEQRLLDVVSDKNPFFTHGVVDWLQHAQASRTEVRRYGFSSPSQPSAPSTALIPAIVEQNWHFGNNYGTNAETSSPVDFSSFFRE